MIDTELRERFARIVAELDSLVQAAAINVEDDARDVETRHWLDGIDTPLDWSGPGISPDEWFFITTLYGTMNLKGRWTHIRRFFPLFVRQIGRDVRNFTPERLADWKLRQPTWMKPRLCRMSNILRQTGLSMGGYVAVLRNIESMATPSDPMPALDRITSDHRACGIKTLSVFVRDCVQGNCFPIDSRVKRQLVKYSLPVDERLLVSLCLAQHLNPRRTARIFYEEAGITATPRAPEI